MKRCPSFERLSRAASGDLPAAVEAHLRACPRCGETIARIEGLRRRAQAIPVEALAPQTVRALEGRILDRALPLQRRAARRPRFAAFAAIAASLAAVVFLVLPGDRPANAGRGRIVEASGAQYEHRVGAVELVDLRTGAVAIEVEKLRPGERFVVRTEDAEVEVRGTVFEVLAEAGRLQRVAVRRGAVEVRFGDRAPVLVRAGERWTRAAAIAQAEADGAQGLPSAIGAVPGGGKALDAAPVDAVAVEAPGRDLRSAAPSGVAAVADGCEATERAPSGAVGGNGARVGRIDRLARVERTSAKTDAHESGPAAATDGQRMREGSGAPSHRAKRTPVASMDSPGANEEPAHGTDASAASIDPRRTLDGGAAAAEPRGESRVAMAAIDPTASAPSSTRDGSRGEEPLVPFAGSLDAAPPAAERAFAAAWRRLRAGDPAGAAAGFARVEEMEPAPALAEDAAYWRIVALGRSGDEEATAAMEAFLRRHPASERAGEVRLMLGLRRLAAGEIEAARALLEEAALDASPAVRARAIEALERIDRPGG